VAFMAVGRSEQTEWGGVGKGNYGGRRAERGGGGRRGIEEGFWVRKLFNIGTLADSAFPAGGECLFLPL